MINILQINFGIRIYDFLKVFFVNKYILYIFYSVIDLLYLESVIVNFYMIFLIVFDLLIIFNLSS